MFITSLRRIVNLNIKKKASYGFAEQEEDVFPLLLTSYFYNLERKIHCRNWLESFVENLELLLAI